MPKLKLTLKTINSHSLCLKPLFAFAFALALALVGCDTNSGSSTVTPAEPVQPVQPSGPKTYIVTFVTNAGGGVFTNQTITEGSNAVRPAVPVRSGYNFVDWYKENSFNTVFLFDREKISNHLTLYAKWTTKLVVTFDSTGGSELARQEVTSNEKATRPAEDPTRTGFTFKGWFTTAATNTKFDFDTVRIRANTTIYAAWQQNTYTVTFITNVGDPNFAVQRVLHSSNAVKPATDPNRAGLIFGGWYEDTAGTTPFNFSTKTITGNITLYAKWLSPFRVTFDTDGGSAVAVLLVSNNGKVKKPTDPTRADRAFVGWYKEPGKVTPFDFATERITGNITIYALWGYEVTYHLNGGSLANVGSGTVKKAEAANTNLTFLRSPYPTRSVYYFGGWYRDSGLTQPFYPELQPITANTNLYVKWQLNTVSGGTRNNPVNFDMRGGSPVLWPLVYALGTTWGQVKNSLPAVSNRNNTNIIFSGWRATGTTLTDSFPLSSLRGERLYPTWGIGADANKGFSLHADNASPGGLAYYNGHFYVGDEVDKKLYAYNVTTGARDTSKEAISSLPSILSLAHADDAARNRQGFYVGGSDGVVRFYSNNGGANPSRNINLKSINTAGRVWGLDYKDGFLYVLITRDFFDNFALIKFNVSDNTSSTQNKDSGFFGLLVDNQQVFVNLSLSAGWFLISYSSGDFSRQADKDLTLSYTGITSNPENDRNLSLTQHDGYYYLLNRRLKRVIAYPKP